MYILIFNSAHMKSQKKILGTIHSCIDVNILLEWVSKYYGKFINVHYYSTLTISLSY